MTSKEKPLEEYHKVTYKGEEFYLCKHITGNDFSRLAKIVDKRTMHKLVNKKSFYVWLPDAKADFDTQIALVKDKLGIYFSYPQTYKELLLSWDTPIENRGLPADLEKYTRILRKHESKSMEDKTNGGNFYKGPPSDSGHA